MDDARWWRSSRTRTPVRHFQLWRNKRMQLHIYMLQAQQEKRELRERERPVPLLVWLINSEDKIQKKKNCYFSCCCLWLVLSSLEISLWFHLFSSFNDLFIKEAAGRVRRHKNICVAPLYCLNAEGSTRRFFDTRRISNGPRDLRNVQSRVTPYSLIESRILCRTRKKRGRFRRTERQCLARESSHH